MLEVSSDGMADLEALLAIANVCQIVTVEDIKTMEDIKQRLSLKRSNIGPKQVGLCAPLETMCSFQHDLTGRHDAVFWIH